MLRCWKIIFAGRFRVWMVSGLPQTASLYLDILLLPCWPASVQTPVIRAYGKHRQFPPRNFQRLDKHLLNFSCYDWPSYSSPSHTQVHSRLHCLWRTSPVPRHTLAHAYTRDDVPSFQHSNARTKRALMRDGSSDRHCWSPWESQKPKWFSLYFSHLNFYIFQQQNEKMSLV